MRRASRRVAAGRWLAIALLAAGCQEPADRGEATAAADRVPLWTASPPADLGAVTIDHSYAPLLEGDQVIVASSALGCAGLDRRTGRLLWQEEEIRPAAGPSRAGHAAVGGRRCPTARLRCASPHPGAATPAHEDALRRVRAAGVPAIQVLDRAQSAAGAGAAREILAVRLDRSLTRDAVVLLEEGRLLWTWPLPAPPAPRAEPMRLAADRTGAALFHDGRHAALFPLR